MDRLKVRFCAAKNRWRNRALGVEDTNWLAGVTGDRPVSSANSLNAIKNAMILWIVCACAAFVVVFYGRIKSPSPIHSVRECNFIRGLIVVKLSQTLAFIRQCYPGDLLFIRP